MNKVEGNVVFKPRLSYSLGLGTLGVLFSIFWIFMLMLLINIKPETLYSSSTLLLSLFLIAILFWGVVYLSDAVNGLPQITVSKTMVEVRSMWGVQKTAIADMKEVVMMKGATLKWNKAGLGKIKIDDRYQVPLAEIVRIINARRKTDPEDLIL